MAQNTDKHNNISNQHTESPLDKARASGKFTIAKALKFDNWGQLRAESQEMSDLQWMLQYVADEAAVEAIISVAKEPTLTIEQRKDVLVKMNQRRNGSEKLSADQLIDWACEILDAEEDCPFDDDDIEEDYNEAHEAETSRQEPVLQERTLAQIAEDTLNTLYYEGRTAVELENHAEYNPLVAEMAKLTREFNLNRDENELPFFFITWDKDPNEDCWEFVSNDWLAVQAQEAA